MRTLLAFMIVVAPLLAAHPAPHAHAQAYEFRLPEEREVRLSGRALDEDSGRPIPAVVLRAPTKTAVGRYDGSFALDFRARGSVEVLFEKEGYAPAAVGVGESGGVARTVKMRQLMGTLYGVLAGCSYDGRTHRWDDMSNERIELSGVARSGQQIRMAVSPAPDGAFVIANLPVGDYLVQAGERTAEVRIRRRGEAATVSLTARWCMRKEFHPDLVTPGKPDAKGPAPAAATPVPAPAPATPKGTAR